MDVSQVKMQQSDSLCLAVNPPPFDKGGKRGGAGRGIVLMRNQQSVHMARMWCRARDSADLNGLDGERGIA